MQQVYGLAFSMVKGLGLRQKHQLLQYFGDLETLWPYLTNKQHDDPQVLAALDKLQPIPLALAKREMDLLQQHNAWLVTYSDEHYPKALKHIADPPLALFGQGFLPKNKSHYFAVVGTRNPSAYGKRIARQLCTVLSQQGLCLVSGLALGIDTMAHQMCVDQQNPTIAVLGHGLGTYYPKENEHLAKKIQAHGCLLTEYLFDEGPRKQYFPKRNRIVSGISQGVLLVEGAQRSGAGITARLAIEQNKDVYAVPGMIDSPTAYVPNELLAQGAKMVRRAEDILEDFPNRSAVQETLVQHSHPSEEVDQVQDKIIKLLQQEVQLYDDDLQAQLTLTDQELLKALVDLEQKQQIERQLDGRWSLR